MKKFVCLFLIAMLSSGCATLFKQKYAKMSIDSDPQGAIVYINGNRVGQTPMPFKASHKNPITLTFRKEGFQDKTYIVNNSVGGGWVVLDVLGGLIPIVVDAATGAWYTLDETEVKVLLDVQQL